MLEEQHGDTMLAPTNGITVLQNKTSCAETQATLNSAAYRQGHTARDTNPVPQSHESDEAELVNTDAPLSDDLLTDVQGGISGAGVGSIAGGALGIVGVGVLAAGSGVVAVASAPVLIAAGVVGGVAAGIGAGVGALVDLIKGD